MIELLVVIVILAILMAVAAPSFLGQTAKAHASAAKQYLTIGYKAAKADATWAHEGAFGNPTEVAGAINESEPEMHATPGTCPDSAIDNNHSHLVVDNSTHGDTLLLCNDPEHTVYTLKVDATHLTPEITKEVIGNSGEVAGLGTLVPDKYGVINPDYSIAFSGPGEMTDAYSAELGTITEAEALQCQSIDGCSVDPADSGTSLFIEPVIIDTIPLTIANDGRWDFPTEDGSTIGASPQDLTSGAHYFIALIKNGEILTWSYYDAA